jgi:hypothetical protein
MRHRKTIKMTPNCLADTLSMFHPGGRLRGGRGGNALGG